MQKTCWTLCKTYCWIQCGFDQSPGKPVLVICANCLLFALCSVGKMKEGCSVAFVFSESFTFCLNPLILLPWKWETSASLLLPFKGKHTWIHSIMECTESLPRSKRERRGEKKPSQTTTWKYLIKSNAFLFYFVHPPKPRVKIWHQGLAICQSATEVGISASAL